MRLDQEFICSPETRILRWYGYISKKASDLVTGFQFNLSIHNQDKTVHALLNVGKSLIGKFSDY